MHQLHDLVRSPASRGAAAPAVTFRHETLTYADLAALVEQAGCGLAQVGLGKGRRVGIYLEKRIETVVSMLGTSAAGGVVVPINPQLRPTQVGYILRDCDVEVLVTSPERLSLLHDEIAESPSVTRVVLVGADTAHEPQSTRSFDVLSWSRLLHEGGRLPERGIDSDIAAILYTSGSTGMPKGVVLTHRNLLAGAESVANYLEIGSQDVVLAVLPLSFDAGLSQVTTALHSGAHVVLMNYLMASDVVRLCAKHGVTGLTCVPPLWIQLVEQSWTPDAVQSMRYIANTGGRLPKATLESLRATFPAASPFLMYGLTEAFRSTYLDPEEVDRRPDSIGKAIPNADIMVVRPDGTPCEPWEEGELIHRGALVSRGYWNDPVRSAERFRPAPAQPTGLPNPEIAVWSGDIVVRDEEGFLYFVGRRDDMIKTSGFRVSPTEIEEVAYATGLVRDAVALGMDDGRLGQSIVLLVAGHDSVAPDIQALLEAYRRALPPYMVPREILVRSELPRSPNGKFDRALLRRELTP